MSRKSKNSNKSNRNNGNGVFAKLIIDDGKMGIYKGSLDNIFNDVYEKFDLNIKTDRKRKGGMY